MGNRRGREGASRVRAQGSPEALSWWPSSPSSATLPRGGTDLDCHPTCSLNKLIFILLCSAHPLDLRSQNFCVRLLQCLT